ncbi:hypothetical protein GSI_00001 [Ganoderma sinense ZZ0214-1]|uniref:Glycosyl hydrolase family 92 domain-containing protein n=1 Tax=Ganoderma sinense ZZ0214-1 TaxID=1077348 RepID=A0A2G8SRG8_9APHY|nr:hypothetical protein GSI_00001 [Ganoderma sinense ZZ0214-1]
MARGSLLSLILLVVVASTDRLHSRRAPAAFCQPPSKAVDHVDPLIGNGGYSPNGSGGMIPSTAPPFAMTRWVAQTRLNRDSITLYNYSDTTIHGFQGTHEPAIWMGESGSAIVVPGAGTVRSKFEDRGMNFAHANETSSASYYTVVLDAIEGGTIRTEQSATSRVGHMRFTFEDTQTPYVLLEATRAQVSAFLNPKVLTYPNGTITIDPAAREVSGSNPDRHNFVVDPSHNKTIWSAFFVARFDQDFASYGTVQNGTITEDAKVGGGQAAVGARANLDKEIPDGTSLERTAYNTRKQWAEKLDRIQIEGASEAQLETIYTEVFHTLQYPSEQDKDGKYYSGYDNQVHSGNSYTSYSDTFHAEWAWLMLLTPERIPGMVQSMLQDYKEGGWLPMWKNIVETNVMIGTHSDSLVAEAVFKGFRDFDLDTAWEAVHKDATVPPNNDVTTSYYDRQLNVGYEVRAGLSSVYATKGWVATDIHSEAASRTFDYAYDDYAVSVLSTALNKTDDAEFFRARALSAPWTIFNNDTGFMQARPSNGSWGAVTAGWAEGDKWAYTFDVVHDVPTLIEKRGGNQSFVNFLDEHFNGGHNDHTNEPPHHIPYLYSLAGAASKSQERIREIATDNYNNSINGLQRSLWRAVIHLSNEDCGQMSAWLIFSSLGFYPVNPVSAEYVVGTPFFDKITIDLSAAKHPLVVTASDAPKNPYVHSVTVNDIDIASGGHINFKMSSTPQSWGSGTLAQNTTRY